MRMWFIVTLILGGIACNPSCVGDVWLTRENIGNCVACGSYDGDIDVNIDVTTTDFRALSNLTSVSGYFQMNLNTAMTRVALPRLACVGRDVYFKENALLDSIYLPSLTCAGGCCKNFHVFENPMLTSVYLPELQELKEVMFQDNPLTYLDLVSLVTVNKLYVKDTALTTLSLPHLDTCTIFRIQDNAALKLISVPILTRANIFIANTPIYCNETTCGGFDVVGTSLPAGCDGAPHPCSSAGCQASCAECVYGTCTNCSSGFMLTGGECVCPAGTYGLADEVSCVGCPDTNCEVCAGGTCSDCVSGFILSIGGECVSSCPTGASGVVDVDKRCVDVRPVVSVSADEEWTTNLVPTFTVTCSTPFTVARPGGLFAKTEGGVILNVEHSLVDDTLISSVEVSIDPPVTVFFTVEELTVANANTDNVLNTHAATAFTLVVGLPGAPSILVERAGPAEVSVSVSLPESTGGLAISRVKVFSGVENSLVALGSVPAGVPAVAIVVPDLEPAEHTFCAVACTPGGCGEMSSAVSIVVPGAEDVGVAVIAVKPNFLDGPTAVTVTGGPFVRGMQGRVGTLDINTTFVSSSLLMFGPTELEFGYHDVSVLFADKVVATMPDGLYFSAACLENPDAEGCSTCPVCTVCPGGGRMWPEPGCWTEDESKAPVKCMPPSSCEGGRHSDCRDGYEGVLCVACSGDYYVDGVGCSVCGGSYILSCVAKGAAMLALLVLITRRTRVVFVGCHGLLCVQTIRAVGQMSKPPLPYFWRGFYSALGLTTFDASFLRLDCTVDTPSPFALVFVFTTVQVVVLILLTMLAMRVLCPERMRGGVMCVVVLLYFNTSTVALQALWCQSIQDQFRLVVEPNIVCFSRAHVPILVGALLTVIVYVGALPLCFAYCEHYSMGVEREVSLLGKWWTPMLIDLDDRAQRFVPMLIGRQLCLAVAVALLRNQPTLQVVSVVFILCVHVLYTMVFDSFTSRTMLAALVLSSVIGIMGAVCNFVILIGDQRGSPGWIVAGAVVIVGTCVVLLLLGVELIRLPTRIVPVGVYHASDDDGATSNEAHLSSKGESGSDHVWASSPVPLTIATGSWRPPPGKHIEPWHQRENELALQEIGELDVTPVRKAAPERSLGTVESADRVRPTSSHSTKTQVTWRDEYGFPMAESWDGSTLASHRHANINFGNFGGSVHGSSVHADGEQHAGSLVGSDFEIPMTPPVTGSAVELDIAGNIAGMPVRRV